MGNLLNRKESFIWDDQTNDIDNAIKHYNAALNESRALKDIIYCPSEVFHPDSLFNYIFKFLWSDDGNSFASFRNKFTWISPDSYQILINMANLLGPDTPQFSQDWQRFDTEFTNQHNSMIGIEDINYIEPIIYNIPSLVEFHSTAVSTFSYEERKRKLKYFKKYYNPKLTKPAGEIKSLIAKSSYPPIIERLDTETIDPKGKVLHNEKTHIHFKEGKKEAALYIDGTWKHNRNNFVIPKDICELIIGLGFDLPDDYY